MTLAGKLNALGIPVLLTAQVDSVRKAGENDAEIPANVAEAVNFYQAEGFLHGRTAIRAASPNRTAILATPGLVISDLSSIALGIHGTRGYS